MPTTAGLVPYSVPFVGATRVAPEDISALVLPVPPQAAQDYWELGPDSSSQIGLVNQRSLTLQAGGATAAPTFGSAQINIPSGGPNGVYADAANVNGGNDRTVIALVQLAALAAATRTVFFGNATTSSANGGFMAYQAEETDDSVTFLSRGFSTQTVALPEGATASDWVFIGVSHTATERAAVVGAGGSAEASGTFVPRVGTQLISLGNTLYSSASFYNAFSAAAFAVLPSALTADEMRNLHMIVRERLRVRGITVL